MDLYAGGMPQLRNGKAVHSAQSNKNDEINLRQTVPAKRAAHLVLPGMQ